MSDGDDDPDFDRRIGDTKYRLEHVKQLSGGGTRVDVETADGRKWRLDVNSTGGDYDVVTSWENEQLADIDEPDWLSDVLARLARV